MKKLLSLLISLCLILSVANINAFAVSINAVQLFKYSEHNADEGFESGITVLENGDIYVTTSKNYIRGFKADGSSNGYAVQLPVSYSGNLCSSSDGTIFAHSITSDEIFVLEPLKNNVYIELDAGDTPRFLTTDSKGYLYSLHAGYNNSGKKIAVIERAKISSIKKLKNGDSISWEKTYNLNYDAPASDGNAYPQALAVDSQNNAYIVDRGSSNGYDASVNGIYKYNLSSGKITLMKFASGSLNVSMKWLYSVNADSFGNVAVLSRNSYMIALFRPGSVVADSLIETKGYAEDIASDKNGDLYFESSGNVSAGNSVFKCNLNNVKATLVKISKTSLSLTIGGSYMLSASVLPSNATNKNVIFSSSNTSVATVSTSGKITAKSAGKATITVKSAQGSFKKTCSVSVSKKPNTLKVKGKTAKLKYTKLKKKNQSVALKKAITVSNAKGKVTYTKSSGNKKITINKTTGKITVKKGLKKGTYKLKVKVKAAGNNTYKAATKTVTVTVKVVK
ncbi:MAG: Ig-like domain-containing protein [Eubacterium sp.]|nr:Ig-like domain-containing protein [Eubacterium sp.]